MIFALSATLIGLCWGSFLNVVAVRLIKQQTLITRSACQSCHIPLMWYEMIPIFSWIFLRGRCSQCNSSISAWYPAIELITSILFFALVLHEGALLHTIIIGAIASCLIVTIRTDGEHQLLIVPILYLLYILGFLSVLFDATDNRFTNIITHLLSAVIAWGLITFFAQVYQRIRGRVGIGDGDGMLLGAIGMALGPSGIISALILGPWIGILHIIYLWHGGSITTTTPVPFGAYCCIAALIEIGTGFSIISLFSL